MYCIDRSTMETKTDLASLTMLPLSEIMTAKKTMEGVIMRTPLVPLNLTDENSDKKIYLKLENLHSSGSFKMRGAYNALCSIPDEKLRDGVYTASTGNFALGLAWSCRKRGIKCTVIARCDSAKMKLETLGRLGAEVTIVSRETWYQVIADRTYKDIKGTFIHPAVERTVIAGNGTIGVEIFEDLPQVDAVVVPYGGGGLTCGVGSALKALKPSAKIYACEVETATPLKSAFLAGEPVVCESQSGFVDGMGGNTVLPDMWNLVNNLVDETLVVSLEEICSAIRFVLERNHVVAEGAGGAPVAAALSGKIKEKNIVCIISGGNIDTDRLQTILNGSVPI
ncbi:L-threonine ammonia-lyase-like [Tubulanus polymorphus]|uniref:L-threonine ammonia-lyase-like n=1 Tax=Tubulanus polymorphus TaxID=672921 RepID=UPI003DA66210